MTRRDIPADQVWAQLSALLPSNGQRRGRWKNHRRILEGILWKLPPSAPWRDVPQYYGAWQTCYNRFARWRRDGTWDRLLARVRAQSDAAGDIRSRESGWN